MSRTGPNIWRPRLDSHCVGSAAVTILGVVALLLGCRGSSGSDQDASTPEALADAAGCANIIELDPEIAPIRGQAATRGISCDLDGEVVHIFARAPIGDTSAVGLRQAEPSTTFIAYWGPVTRRVRWPCSSATTYSSSLPATTCCPIWASQAPHRSAFRQLSATSITAHSGLAIPPG
jgi:hypothetical protein